MVANRRRRSVARTSRALAVVVGAAVLASGGTSAAVSASSAEETVVVLGAPLVHDFTPAVTGESVEGMWTIRHTGAGTASLDGTLVADAPGGSLAHALGVEYGRPDASGVVRWNPAGTLARPTSLVDAYGERGLVLQGDAALRVPVRVTLLDAAALDGSPGDVLRVSADFVVGYTPGTSSGEQGAGVLADGAGGRAPGERAGAGSLALTGFGAVWLLPCCAVVLLVGRALRRRARSSGPGGGDEAAPLP